MGDTLDAAINSSENNLVQVGQPVVLLGDGSACGVCTLCSNPVLTVQPRLKNEDGSYRHNPYPGDKVDRGACSFTHVCRRQLSTVRQRAAVVPVYFAPPPSSAHGQVEQVEGSHVIVHTCTYACV